MRLIDYIEHYIAGGETDTEETTATKILTGIEVGFLNTTDPTTKEIESAKVLTEVAKTFAILHLANVIKATN